MRRVLHLVLLIGLALAQDAEQLYAGTKYAGWKLKTASKGKHAGRRYLVNPSDKNDKVWEVCDACHAHEDGRARTCQ